MTQQDTGSWYGLLAILRAARDATVPAEADCPNDGTPLVDGHCPFDGYRTPPAQRAARSSGSDWGGLRAALTATPTRRDLDDDPPEWG